jgi:ABC-2 type transport system permease protein
VTRLLSLSMAMGKGFLRDRTAVFFTILFPLMFLVIFGGIFKDQTIAKSTVLQIGPVAVLDQLPPDAQEELSKVLEVTRTDDRAGALEKVRKGDAEAAIEQQGNTVVLHYSAADQVKAGTIRGIVESLVQQGNLAAAGVSTPALSMDVQQVEDESLKTIQYITPGLLGWAVAVGAMFGAALTLVTWRQKKLLRRLRLSPVNTFTVIGARVGVSIGVALAQTAIFITIALLPYFGLRLSDYWWMAIPLVVAGTLAFMSLGLLAGAWAKTPEAASAIANLIVLPMAFLSGSFFPIDAAPAWLRTLSNVFPLKHLNEAMLDVMVRGEGPSSVLPTIALLLGFAAIVGALAARLFRWDDV